MKTVKTPKGTELPLISLKGKDYLQVAHRLVWFNEAVDRFRIVTDLLQVSDDQTVARAVITVFNEEGIEIKCSSATKRETKKDFPDHTEKAETGAIGRALALMGYGTQFAVADLDEGDRLADAPVTSFKRENAKAPEAPAAKQVEASTPAVTAPAKISTFRKKKPEEAVAASAPAAQDNGWT